MATSTPQHRREYRLVYLAVMVLWLGVTIAACGFHHHGAGENCNDVGCPFALVAFNLPILVAALVLLTGAVPHLADPDPVPFPAEYAGEARYLRGPPRPFLV